MRVLVQTRSAIGSKRAARIVGVAAVIGSVLAACGDDGSPGAGGDAGDDGGGGSSADGASGQEGGSGGDASLGGGDTGAGDGASGDGSSGADTGAGDGAQSADGRADGAGADGAGADGAGADAAGDAGVDANGQTLVIRVNPRNDCTVTTTPPSPIKIPAGQWFHATFINVGEISTDIAKRDQFNVVPLVLGLGPTMTYADTIRPWCQGVSGTFSFEITPCQGSPYELEVDCGP